MAGVLLRSERRWTCPNRCAVEQVTKDPHPHVVLHTCRNLRGLTAPLVPAGTRCKVEAIERPDYVNGERVQLDPQYGRPVMSVVTTRDNGRDTIIFAPTATGTGAAHG